MYMRDIHLARSSVASSTSTLRSMARFTSRISATPSGGAAGVLTTTPVRSREPNGALTRPPTGISMRSGTL